MRRSQSPHPPPDGAPDHSPARSPGAAQRLWSPWRMRYVSGSGREDGCIFCNRLAEENDAQSLILARGERAFVIMNLFPYNTGHVMIVPYAHVASPEDAGSGVLAEMGVLRAPVLRALRRALNPDGFNLGLNVGAVAGAGVTDHLHEHVVPRWAGDANFMPILAATTVMPELIPVTYAKLRPELDREIRDAANLAVVVLSPDHRLALVGGDGRPLAASAQEGEPLWRSALRAAHARGAGDPQLVGWAGSTRAGSGASAVLVHADLANVPERAADAQVIAAERLGSSLTPEARAAIERLGLRSSP